MAEKIFRIVNAVLVEIPARLPARRYRYKRIADENAYVELTDAEEADRDAEEAAPPRPFSGLGRCVATCTGQVIANADATAISFDTVVRDVGNYHRVANPDRLTVGPAQGGEFSLVVSVSFNESTAQAPGVPNVGERLVQVRVNGTAVRPGGVERRRASVSDETEFSLVLPEPEFAAGDVIRVFVRQNCGGSMAVDARIALRRLERN